jgi:hypothetical protein
VALIIFRKSSGTTVASVDDMPADRTEYPVPVGKTPDGKPVELALHYRGATLKISGKTTLAIDNATDLDIAGMIRAFRNACGSRLDL